MRPPSSSAEGRGSEPRRDHDPRTGDGEVVVEWVAVVRGRSVRCRWDGELHGDPEVMERLVHLPPDRIDLTTLDGVRAALDLALIDPVERLVPARIAGDGERR